MRQKIGIVRGTSNTLTLSVVDANGDGYTLSEGEKLLFGVKEKPEDAELLIKKIITECTDGVCTLEFDPADTIDLKYGRYIYDIGLRSGGKYYPVIKASPFVIEPNVTKWGDGS